MENILTNPIDTSMFVPVFLFWGFGTVLLLAAMSGLAWAFYYFVWMPWMSPVPSAPEMAVKIRQLGLELEAAGNLIKGRGVTDQRATIPFEQAINYLHLANRLAIDGKRRRRQLGAVQKGLDEVAAAHHWVTWLIGFQIPPRGLSTGCTKAPDNRSLAQWQSQPRQFAVKIRVFKRPFIYLDTSLPDVLPEHLLTFAEANAVAIIWEIENDGDMAEAIVVDVYTNEVIPLFSQAGR